MVIIKSYYNIYLITHSCYELHEALQCSVWHVTLVVTPITGCCGPITYKERGWQLLV